MQNMSFLSAMFCSWCRRHERSLLCTVMPWDPVKYLGVRLIITGDLTFERDYVRKKMLDTIKQMTKHMYHPQQIHWVVQVAIIPSFMQTFLFILFQDAIGTHAKYELSLGNVLLVVSTP